MAKAWIPFLSTPLAERIWQIASAILAGTCGNILLIFFFSGFTDMGFQSPWPYWIMAFNTALTGYMLVEKAGSGLRLWTILCAGAGLANAVATLLATNHYLVRMADAPAPGLGHAGIIVMAGAACSVLGGLLAMKYLKLKPKH